MKKKTFAYFGLLASIVATIGLGTVPTRAAEQITPASVELPAEIKAVFLAQMLGHVVGLDTIMNALANQNYKGAAVAARTAMGVPRGEGDDLSGSVKGGQPGPGLGIGKHLPKAMKAIGARFHKAANSFADLADKVGESDKIDHIAIYQALSKVTNQCRDCHDRFTIR